MQKNKAHLDAVSNFLSVNSIRWKFIPARSPHFGGLWESTVKSVKRHLYKITNNKFFTYEELNTLFCQIEAILNSRPLIPLSDDPNDTAFLTPAHFLVGDSLIALPEPSLLEVRENRLTRLQMLQQMQQKFWRSWSADYLTSLQTRSKWHHRQSTTPKIGSLDLLRDGTIPPLVWRRGRIVDVHPGPDGIIRVISIKTSTGVVKRAVNGVIPLLEEEH